MQNAHSLQQLLGHGENSATALSATATPNLSYSGLRALLAQTMQSLNQMGIGRQDRVAIVLQNGATMASAFLGVACAATAAPLNPTYRAEEFEFYLGDLNAKALLVESDSTTPAIAVAEKMGIAVIRLQPTPERGAGSFTLLAGDPANVANPASTQHGGYAQADDIALVLHTSGTTSRPKIVPLTHRNVCATARNICAVTRFSASDCGLNIMPLFHIHGLIAGVIAPLAAGGRVFCSPGFNALKFFGWMQEARPTWFTAVPTMHQAILARAANNVEIIAANPLRFIRSSSASMPTQVIRELESVFNAPLIESYGMTEAAHQMTSNLLPPGNRKPGSVGVAAGPEVAVLGEGGKLLPAGEIGEVAIRGENVTLGYENNPKANADAFVNGWFLTGDQGMMDGEGFLTLTGRLKEIINRGGEKISPLEVDEILMAHSAVAQVVTFAMPHDKLGEDVAAAVVLREGQSVTEKELREFCSQHLADFKIPRKILFMDEIPKGATGKLQRIGLAKKLGLG